MTADVIDRPIDHHTESAALRGECPLLPVVGGDLLVPVLPRGTVRHANLDYAASAPALRDVADHVTEVLPYYASVHRGAGYASQVMTAAFESARGQVASFVGARYDDVVVFTKHTTDALNLLASAVPANLDVVCLDVEHHANLLPWRGRRHVLVRSARTVAETLDSLRAALASGRVGLVAVTGASNVTGECLPLGEIVQLAHKVGARVAVDAAQLAPHRRIDLQASGVDYIAFSGHKLYAPYGAGALVGRRDWLDDAPPYLAGGGAVREVGLDTTAWADAPHRHEAGSPNVVGALALARACTALASLAPGQLDAHERALRDRLVDGMRGIAGLRFADIWPDDAVDRIGVVTFCLAGVDPGHVAAYLSAEYGVSVRDGRFCAHPLLSILGLAAGAVRASVGVGSCAEDVDRLVAAVAEYQSRGARCEYVRDGGRWQPLDDARPLPAFAGVNRGGASPCSL